MNNSQCKAGVLIVSHGSPREEANAFFRRMVGNIASRADGLNIKPAFFSLARPTIEDSMAELVAEGATSIYLMPYFLFNGQHVRSDIPEQTAKCREKYPGVPIEIMPTLQDEPAMEEIILDRLQVCSNGTSDIPTAPEAITSKSKRIIESRLGPARGDSFARSVITRVIHATADFSFSRSLRFHPDAVTTGRRALSSARNIVCDVRMTQAGITKAAGCAIHCAIGDDDVAARAKDRGCTRAAAAMEKLADTYNGGIVAIGNAPTALWKVMELARNDGPRPALVVGVPVGFVGALESKRALIDSDLCYVTNVSNRGGSPVAAAIVNALAVFDEK